nr:unnamed protein product [Callosobruchus analis]
MDERRTAYPSGEQKKCLVDKLKSHPLLMRGKFTNSFSRLDARREWERIAQDLNSIPGARKDWIRWRKTGGGPPLPPSSHMDREIMDVINPISYTGHATVMEAQVEYLHWESKDPPSTVTETVLIETHQAPEPAQETPKRNQLKSSTKRLKAATSASENLSDLCKIKLQMKKKYFADKLAMMERKETREAAHAAELLKLRKEELTLMEEREKREAAHAKEVLELNMQKIRLLADIANNLRK